MFCFCFIWEDLNGWNFLEVFFLLFGIWVGMILGLGLVDIGIGFVIVDEKFYSSVENVILYYKYKELFLLIII